MSDMMWLPEFMPPSSTTTTTTTPTSNNGNSHAQNTANTHYSTDIYPFPTTTTTTTTNNNNNNNNNNNTSTGGTESQAGQNTRRLRRRAQRHRAFARFLGQWAVLLLLGFLVFVISLSIAYYRRQDSDGDSTVYETYRVYGDVGQVTSLATTDGQVCVLRNTSTTTMTDDTTTTISTPVVHCWGDQPNLPPLVASSFMKPTKIVAGTGFVCALDVTLTHQPVLCWGQGPPVHPGYQVPDTLLSSSSALSSWSSLLDQETQVAVVEVVDIWASHSVACAVLLLETTSETTSTTEDTSTSTSNYLRCWGWDPYTLEALDWAMSLSENNNNTQTTTTKDDGIDDSSKNDGSDIAVVGMRTQTSSFASPVVYLCWQTSGSNTRMTDQMVECGVVVVPDGTKNETATDEDGSPSVVSLEPLAIPLELALDTTENTTIPTLLDANLITSLAMMDDFICVVTTTGTQPDTKDPSLICWEYQPASASTVQPFWESNEIPVTTTATTTTITSNNHSIMNYVYAGADNDFCVTTTEGTVDQPPVYCFLGTSMEPLYVPVELGGETLTDIVAGSDHFCGIRQSDSLVFCWGERLERNAIWTEYYLPMDVVGENEEDTDLFALGMATGVGRTCMIHAESDHVYCWGGGFEFIVKVRATMVDAGEDVICVVDSSDDLSKCVYQGTVFILDSSVETLQQEISPDDMVCVLTKEDSLLQCYRADCVYKTSFSYTQLVCNGESEFDANPQAWFGNGQPLDSFRLGPSHICGVVSSTQSLECTPLTSSTPSHVPLAVQSSKLLDYDIGEGFACAILRSGEISCWSFEEDEEENSMAQKYVLDPPAGAYYTSIAVSEYEACAITQDQAVHCWGRPYVTSTYVPLDLGWVVEIQGGSGHFCARQINQEMFCWGTNSYGQVVLIPA